MFVLDYKSNTLSPPMSDPKLDTTTSDIISDDVNELKIELSHISQYKSFAYPIEQVLETCKVNIPVEELIRKELTYIITSLTNIPQTEASKITIKDISEVNTNNLSEKYDVIYLTDINSRKQISKLSNISSAYQTVYLVKPMLEDPFSEKIYVILTDKSDKPLPSPSKLIYRLSSIVDLALAVYSKMIYCCNLSRSCFSDGIPQSFVKIPKITIPPKEEYKLYLEGLINYCHSIVK